MVSYRIAKGAAAGVAGKDLEGNSSYLSRELFHRPLGLFLSLHKPITTHQETFLYTHTILERAIIRRRRT